MQNEIGKNPLPIDVQEKLGEFIDWLVKEGYDLDQGSTAFYWKYSYLLAQDIGEQNGKV